MSVNSQSSRNSILKLDDEITLSIGISPFGKELYKVDSVRVFDWYKIVRIDDNLVFGTDGGTPFTELVFLKLITGDNEISLETTCMFNPNGYKLFLRSE